MLSYPLVLLHILRVWVGFFFSCLRFYSWLFLSYALRPSDLYPACWCAALNYYVRHPGSVSFHVSSVASSVSRSSAYVCYSSLRAVAQCVFVSCCDDVEVEVGTTCSTC